MPEQGIDTKDNRNEEPFPNPWSWVQTANGIVVLTVLNPQMTGLMPFLKFTRPERLLAFQDDLNIAVRRFIPIGLREAIKLIDKSWVDMPMTEEERKEENTP